MLVLPEGSLAMAGAEPPMRNMTQGEANILKPNFLGLFKSSEDVVTLKSGECLFSKGDPADRMYVVLSGELHVGDGNLIFERLSPGSMMGEMGLIDHAPRAATVTAQSDCTLAEIDEKRFLFLVQQTPSFALNVLRLLSQRLRRMDALVSE
jgi:CRP/FNR family transcriptional regulator, cyclic AMP receptor protein